MQTMRYGTCAGAWGDVICSLGNFRELVGEGGMIFYGGESSIADFLSRQSFIHDVKHIRPPVGLDWISKFWNPMVNTPNPPFDPMDMITHGLSIPSSSITATHYDYSLASKDIVFWTSGNLSSESKEWADNICCHLPKQFYLIQPYSLNSNDYTRHWPHWGSLMRRLLNGSGVPIVITGHKLPPTLWGQHPGVHTDLFDMIGKIPSMMHVFALAERATGIITTSNSLAHWCQVQSLPAVVCCNTTSSRPDYYFRRILEWPTLTCLNHSATIEDAMFAIHQQFSRC